MKSDSTSPTLRLGIRIAMLLVLLTGLVALTGGRIAAALPNDFVESRFVDGLSDPTAMAFAPDGRLFVLQQGGQVRVVKNGQLLATPFTTVAVQDIGERGLLGIAFDPDFDNNGYVYLYYTTNEATPRNRISRFTAVNDAAEPGSATVILNLETLSTASNHNGGALHFGPDGKLYVATGDNANSANSQTLNNRLGKLLRLNSDGTIPADNPFYNTASGVNRSIWALGLRNPYTFAVQPGSGDILINDVGQDTWEEINEGVAGANYGWPACEGACSNPNFVDPIHVYDHGQEERCAITGGAYYNPDVAQFPAEYVGDYFFGDYCGGWIRRLDLTTGTATPFADGIDRLVDLDVGPDGALYYLSRSRTAGGAVYRFDYTPDQPPMIHTDPADRTVSVGQPATFTVGATGSTPLEYQWQRNGDDIPGADEASYTLAAAALADNGANFRVIVSNAIDLVTSNEATLTVVENQPPTATITKPASGTLYSGGTIIRYAATATDAEDGTLPASAFTWRVDFHHDTHTHPHILSITNRRSGEFTIPRTGHTAADVWYRIHLTVRDSAGVAYSTFVDVEPRLVTLTLTTNPPGLSLTLNGQPFTTPYTFESVVGIRQVIGAPTPQTMGGHSYRFRNWSDGKAATHTITAPANARTYLATFRR